MANAQDRKNTTTDTALNSPSFGEQPRNAGTTQPAPIQPGTGGTAAATARSFYDQAKDTAGQAYEAVTEKAATKLDAQKSTLSGGLSTVADSFRQVSGNLSSSKTDSGLAEAAAKYTDKAAQKVENVASYFETHNVREMARDLEGFARRNPAVFLGVAFGIGFLTARFLKSTTPSLDSGPRGSFEGAGYVDRDTREASTRLDSTTPDSISKPI
jgi:ElaB/YqjD/DUF883 family membrane-anchored ribosome-binding protein